MQQIKFSICIIGLGARTSVGLSAPSSAAAVRAGITRISEHPYMIDKSGESMIVAMASYLPDDAVGIERFWKLALPAAQEAFNFLSILTGGLPPIPLIVGLPAERPGLPGNLAGEIANRFKDMVYEHYRFSE